MPNTYFNHANPFARFTTVRAEAANSTFRAIEAAFDKIPSVAELNQGSRNYAVSTNSGNSYSITIPFVVTSYAQGLTVSFFASVANPTTATLNINNAGPATIRRFDGSNLLPLDIRAMSVNTVVYDGSNFRLVSMHGGTEALATASATAAASSATSAATSASEALTNRNTAVSSATNAQASAATASNAASSIRSGFRNLLINPFFWFSQRIGNVLSGTHAAGTFIRDRWKTGASGATWSISSQTITVSSGSVLQIVDGRNVHFGGSHTLSWNGTATGRVNGNIVAKGASVNLPGYTNIVVEFSGGSFQYPQLEFGSIKTEPEFRHTDAEIDLCQRYFQKSYEINTAPGTINAPGFVTSFAMNNVFFYDGRVFMPVSMRGIPVISIYSVATGTIGRASSTGSGDRTVVAGFPGSKYFFINGLNNTSLVVGASHDYHWTADAEI